MKRLRSSLKKLVLLFLLLLVVFLPVYSEENVYEITEQELVTLETTLEQQKLQIEMQEKQLNSLTIQLNLLDSQLTTSNKVIENAQKSFQMYDQEVRKNKIEAGIWGSLLGIILGGVAASVVYFNIK